MTKEEIRQAAQDWDGSGMATPAEEEAFIAGAEWMREEMIEKAVEWMRNNLHEFSTNVSYKSLFDEFKQAMQDETGQRL